MGGCMSKKESKYLPSGMANISNEAKNRSYNQNMSENSGKTYFEYLFQYNTHQSDTQLTKYSPPGKSDANYSFVVEPKRASNQDVSWKDNTSSFSIVYIPECCANDEPDYMLYEVPIKGALYTARKVEYGNILLFSHQKYVPSNIEPDESNPTSRGKDGSVKSHSVSKDQKLLQIVVENALQSSWLEFMPVDSDSEGLIYMDPREKLACFSIIPGPKTSPYFSAAINLLLEHPFVFKVYEEVFLKETAVPDGSIELPICLQGIWVRQQVQKSLLVHKETKDIQLSITNKREYWIHLLEKAFIASHGTMASFQKKLKSVLFTLHKLTGMPYQEIFIKGQQMTPVSIQYYLRGCLEAGNPAALSKLGGYGRGSTANIYSGTPYYLIDEVPSRDGNSYFALRYPWSKNFDPLEFKSSKQIVSSAKGILNNPKYESCIFMTAEDILEHMDVVQSLKVMQDAYQFCMKLGEEPNPFTYIELDVKSPGNSYLQVCQEEVIESDPMKNLKQYHKIGIVLLKKCKDNDGQTFLRVELQHTDSCRDIWTWADLRVGSYFILVVSADCRYISWLAQSASLEVASTSTFTPSLTCDPTWSARPTSTEDLDQGSRQRTIARSLSCWASSSIDSWTRRCICSLTPN